MPDSIRAIEAGEYLNIEHEGRIRVSISEANDEILVYADSVDEPMARFTLDGKRKY